MSCRLSLAVSEMMLSSNATRIPPSSGSSAPSVRSTASSARQMPAIAPSRACSWRRTLRMSAELSADTSVAVFTYPDPSSMSKYLSPNPHRSPRVCSATRSARSCASVLSVGANSWIVSSVLMTLRNTVQSALPKGMATREPLPSRSTSNITSDRNTLIFPLSISLIIAS